MTAAEAIVGARYRVTGGRVVHVVGEVVGTRLTSLCRRDSRYRGASEWHSAHIADPMHLARWSMCAECERRAVSP